MSLTLGTQRSPHKSAMETRWLWRTWGVLVPLVLLLAAGCESTHPMIGLQTFPKATSWVRQHVHETSGGGPSLIDSGLDPGPHGQLTVGWNLPPGTSIVLSTGRIVHVPMGGALRLVIRVNDPNYLGAVFLQRDYQKYWELLSP